MKSTDDLYRFRHEIKEEIVTIRTMEIFLKKLL